MWSVEYYKTSMGRQPVAEWRDELDKSSRNNIAAKIEKLREKGLELLNTNMLTRILGYEADLYELIGGKYRIATYYDRRDGKFVLLHGFKKTKQRETRQIEQAHRRLHRYLSAKGGQSDG